MLPVHLVYHGTAIDRAGAICNNGINLTVQRPGTDFGQGFYTATQWVQATRWARRTAKHRTGTHENLPHPAIVVFAVDPSDWARVPGRLFTAWAAPSKACALFVRRCRTGGMPVPHPHDWVYGPAYRGPWTLPTPWQGMDQLSVHTKVAAKLLESGLVGIWQQGGNGQWSRVIP